MFRGIKCNICGEIGTHYASSCSERVNVGVPIGLRPQAHEGTASCAADAVLAVKAAEDEDAIDPAQLVALIRKRPDLPAFLRCRACLALPVDAVWCQCCDIFVCQDCLGPPPDATWACPECEQDGVDNFHVIRVVREMITAWFQSVAVLIDPYCASSDEEPVAQKFHHVSKKKKMGGSGC